jgi:hypothetical protein
MQRGKKSGGTEPGKGDIKRLSCDERQESHDYDWYSSGCCFDDGGADSAPVSDFLKVLIS